MATPEKCREAEMKGNKKEEGEKKEGKRKEMMGIYTAEQNSEGPSNAATGWSDFPLSILIHF